MSTEDQNQNGNQEQQTGAITPPSTIGQPPAPDDTEKESETPETGNDDEQNDAAPAPVFDPTGKVLLSDVYGDALDQHEAEELVKESRINEHYKEIMLQQIENGKLLPPYGDVLKRLKSAADRNVQYRPGIDGL